MHSWLGRFRKRPVESHSNSCLSLSLWVPILILIWESQLWDSILKLPWLSRFKKRLVESFLLLFVALFVLPNFESSRRIEASRGHSLCSGGSWRWMIIVPILFKRWFIITKPVQMNDPFDWGFLLIEVNKRGLDWLTVWFLVSAQLKWFSRAGCQ